VIESRLPQPDISVITRHAARTVEYFLIVGTHFNRAFATSRVVAEAAPLPIFGGCYQAAFDWIPMHVPQLFDALATCVDIEVIVARLPERAFVPLYRY
jgi:hypothetical protein